jgi:uncharacterized protein YdaU (DUF1376 family)
MKPEQKGIYLMLIVLLYSRQGSLEINDDMYRIHNCSKKFFDKIFESIKHKFFIKNNKLYHKKVSKELSIAKKRSQAFSEAGLRGAKKRWRGHSEAIAKKWPGDSNENVNEIENENNNENTYSNSSTNLSRSFSSSNSGSISKINTLDMLNKDIESKAVGFLDKLNKLIKPKTKSDRTCYRNITKWLADECRHRRFTPEIFNEAYNFAKEAAIGKNPRALFMSLMKKELGYNTKHNGIRKKYD